MNPTRKMDLAALKKLFQNLNKQIVLQNKIKFKTFTIKKPNLNKKRIKMIFSFPEPKKYKKVSEIKKIHKNLNIMKIALIKKEKNLELSLNQISLTMN